MVDWGPVVVGVVLSLLCELPGSHCHVNFGGFRTNGKAIFLDTLIFFSAFTILTLALHVHIILFFEKKNTSSPAEPHLDLLLLLMVVVATTQIRTSSLLKGGADLLCV
jgi:hypothetical protein